MKTREESERLARLMVGIGQRAGKRMCALVTDMDVPLGYAVGNVLEVIEAIETLRGGGAADVRELSLLLSTEMLVLAGMGEREVCRAMCEEALASGRAFRKFMEMVRTQGGDVACVMDTARFSRAPYSKEICASESGYITQMDTESLGEVSLMLGAGREALGGEIDPSAGFVLDKKTGDAVIAGDRLVTLYTSDEARLEGATKQFLSAVTIGEAPPSPRPLLFARIDSE